MKFFVATLIVLLAGCSLGEEPYRYYQPEEYNYWHTPASNTVVDHPVDTRRQTFYSLRRQFLDLLGPGLGPAIMFSAVGTIASLGYTGIKVDDLSRRINTEKDRINVERERITQNANNIRSTCTALAALLSLPGPSYPEDLNSLVPTPANGVSEAIGSADATKPWPIATAITDGGAALTIDATLAPGLLSLGAVPLGTDVTSAALSILDFNIFRIEMINALNLLDQSIRDITAATPPVCL